jgi:hypothetical protein
VPTKKLRVYATVEPDQAAALEAIAAKYGVSIGWIVRHAVIQLLKSEEAPVQLNLSLHFRPMDKT